MLLHAALNYCFYLAGREFLIITLRVLAILTASFCLGGRGCNKSYIEFNAFIQYITIITQYYLPGFDMPHVIIPSESKIVYIISLLCYYGKVMT